MGVGEGVKLYGVKYKSMNEGDFIICLFEFMERVFTQTRIHK